MSLWIRSRVLLNSFIRYARTTTVFVRPFSLQQQRTNDSRSLEFSRQSYNKQLADFARRLGYEKDELPSLLTTFTTKKFVQSFSSPETNHQCNDRLSTLGRSVMLLYVQEHIYPVYPDLSSDELSDFSTAVTNNEVKKLCKSLGFESIVRIPIRDFNPVPQAEVNADVVLAIIGALYCDQGAQAARQFVEQFILAKLDQLDMDMLIKLEHPKQMLCHVLKEQGRPLPVSRLLQKVTRDQQRPVFMVGVFSGDDLLAEEGSVVLVKAEERAIMTALTKNFDMELKKAPKPLKQKDYQSEDMINIFETNSSSKENFVAKV